MRLETKTVRVRWDDPDYQDLLCRYYAQRLFGDEESAAMAVQHILARSDTKPPARVLDVGCGYGFHAIAFARLGFAVEAFDPGQLVCSHAQENVRQAGMPVRVQCGYVAELQFADLFDLAWLGNHCLGELSRDELKDHFTHVGAWVRSGGRLVMTYAGAKASAPSVCPARTWAETDDYYLMTEKSADSTWRVEDCLYVFKEPPRAIRFIERQRKVSLDELRSAIVQAGFGRLDVFTDLSGTTVANAENFHVFLARKA